MRPAAAGAAGGARAAGGAEDDVGDAGDAGDAPPSPVRGAEGLVVVRVEPSGAEIEVRSGESLMGAAERQGYRWPTVCHGQAKCTACNIVLDAATADAFEPPGAAELAGLELVAGRSFHRGETVRLACQARPVADAVVTKRGVRPRG